MPGRGADYKTILRGTPGVPCPSRAPKHAWPVPGPPTSCAVQPVPRWPAGDSNWATEDSANPTRRPRIKTNQTSGEPNKCVDAPAAPRPPSCDDMRWPTTNSEGIPRMSRAQRRRLKAGHRDRRLPVFVCSVRTEICPLCVPYSYAA